MIIRTWKEVEKELQEIWMEILYDIMEWVVDLYIQIEEIKEEGRNKNV